MRRWWWMMLAELPLLRALPDLTARRRPRVTVLMGPSVPGWVVRVAAAGVAAALVAVTVHRTAIAGELTWLTVVTAAVVVAGWPTPPVAHTVVVGCGVLLAIAGQGPFDPVVLGLVPLAYAVVRLAGWADGLALSARVELAALAVGLPRSIALIGATVGVGAIVMVLAGHPNPVAMVAGGVALVALWYMVRRFVLV